MEHETRKNFNQFQQEPELHVQNRNQGPEIPQLSRSAAYQERQFQRHLQSELDKKRENEPALDTIGERLIYLAAMAAPTIGRAALLAIGTGLAVKGVSVLANHLSNQSIEQHQKDMEELGVPLEDDEEDDYDRTFTGYEDYMNHHNALRAQKGLEPDYTPENGPVELHSEFDSPAEASQTSNDTEYSAYSIQLDNDMQKFTPDNNLTIPEEKITDDFTSINTNATPIEHRAAITLQDEKLTHTAEKTVLKTVNFPAGIGQFKSFMDYKAITDKSTPNYNFTHENANFHVVNLASPTTKMAKIPIRSSQLVVVSPIESANSSKLPLIIKAIQTPYVASLVIKRMTAIPIRPLIPFIKMITASSNFSSTMTG